MGGGGNLYQGVIVTSVSIFDIIGPVMVGPSSSHTAGAAKIGSVARRVCKGKIVEVDFYLHGSFAQTYKGHGTAKALLGGILGMSPCDERIRDSYKIAAEQGIRFSFHQVDLGDVHPNTVKIVMRDDRGEKHELIGSSVGGGKILITNIDGMEMEFTAEYPTIINKHLDKPGTVAKVSSILARYDINIAFLKVFRQSRGSLASMVIETDNKVTPEILEEIQAIPTIKQIMFIDANGI